MDNDPASREVLRVLDLQAHGDAAAHGVVALPGAENMAWDEALLVGQQPATLRLYRWQPHTVSLGYFQAHRDFAGRTGDTPIVRRQTGGGAIWHGEELTFSLAVDAARLPHELLASYRLIHGAIARALQSVGCATQVAPGGKAPHPRHGDPWCFAEIACGDLLLPDGRKLVGSAQRRHRGDGHSGPRVLHHGSIPLVTPPAPSRGCGVLNGLGGSAPDPATLCLELAAAVVSELGAALDLTTEPGPPDDAEVLMARRLAAEKYGTTAFTARR